MNYAFHIDLGDMPYDKWHAMYSAPENKAKRAEWWGPELVEARLGPFQSKCLSYIKENPRCTQTAVSRELECDKSQTSRAVDKLVERGLVVKNDIGQLMAT